MTASTPTPPSPEQAPSTAAPGKTPPAWRQGWLPAGVLVVVILVVSTTVKMSVKSFRGEVRMRMRQQNAQIEGLNGDIRRLHTRIDQLYANPPAQLQ